MTATAVTPRIDYMRQTLILDPVKAAEANAAVFGCGTVGSNAAIEMARLGLQKFDLFDFDEVEAHNLPSQRFDVQHLGMNKAVAVKQQLENLTNNEAATVNVHETKVEGVVMVRGVAILAVDTMESRRLIWERVLRPQPAVSIVLDFRMKANLLQCYAFDPRDERYEATLFTDEEADPGPCGGRTVSYTGALAGCIAANYTRKHLMDEGVPFFTGIDLDAMEIMRSDVE